MGQLFRYSGVYLTDFMSLAALLMFGVGVIKSSALTEYQGMNPMAGFFKFVPFIYLLLAFGYFSPAIIFFTMPPKVLPH